METKEKRPEQADLSRQAPRLDRSTKGPLGTLMLIAFLAYAFMYFVAFFNALLVAKVFIPPIVIEAVLILLAAGVVATRWRWAPALGTLVALFTIKDPLFQPHNIYVFMHPAEYEFSLLILVTAFGLVALVSSAWATVQNFRGAELRLPRFSHIALSALAGMVIGMIIVSLIAATVPQTGAVSTGPNGEPAIHMTAVNFVQNVILVPKGSKLRVINDSSVEHILQNGTWDTNGTPHSGAESGAPTLHNVDITSGSKAIGPFVTAGVYHIYCTIHRGMNLTIVVQ